MPKRARTAKNCLYVWQKPVPSSRAMKRMLFTIKGHLRPYRSAAIPKIVEPTDLNISTRVMPQVIWVLVFLNVWARSVTVRETVKKSNASQDQAKKATAKKSHCWRFSKARRRNGLATFSMGGFSVVIRVAAYRPGDILVSVVSMRWTGDPSRTCFSSSCAMVRVVRGDVGGR